MRFKAVCAFIIVCVVIYNQQPNNNRRIEKNCGRGRKTRKKNAHLENACASSRIQNASVNIIITKPCDFPINDVRLA